METKWRGRTVNYSDKYPRVWWPEHPLAGRDGLVRIHRVVASEKAGRILTSVEHVHHEDEDKNNWEADNLSLTTSSAHASLHGRERANGEYRSCGQCGTLIYKQRCHLKYENSFCDEKCRGLFDRRTEWPGDDALRSAVWSQPVTKIAEALGVTDKAVTKHCKKRGIATPPRGYWTGRKLVP